MQGLLTIVSLFFFALDLKAATSPPSVALWVWAGIPFSSVPNNNDTLYIHQGSFKKSLIREGLSPFPIGKRNIFLVFRLETLDSGERLVKPVKEMISRWEKHRVSVLGVQLDFDSATARLPMYSKFLARFRAALPPKYRLSITGLADWASNANPSALAKVTGSVNEIVFQLYRGRQPIPELARYASKLARVDFPFKVGVLESMPVPEEIKQSSKYEGKILFLTKKQVGGRS